MLYHSQLVSRLGHICTNWSVERADVAGLLLQALMRFIFAGLKFVEERSKRYMCLCACVCRLSVFLLYFYGGTENDGRENGGQINTNWQDIK